MLRLGITTTVTMNTKNPYVSFVVLLPNGIYIVCVVLTFLVLVDLNNHDTTTTSNKLYLESLLKGDGFTVPIHSRRQV